MQPKKEDRFTVPVGFGTNVVVETMIFSLTCRHNALPAINIKSGNISTLHCSNAFQMSSF